MSRKSNLSIPGLLFAIFLLQAVPVSAQYNVTFKPNATVGEDVAINTTYGCTPSHLPQPAEFINWDPCGDIGYGEWTIYALGCSTTTTKSLIRFTEMSGLPCDAVITKAELRLWGPANSGCFPTGNSYYSGSPFPTNEGWVERVTSGWTETGVTWSTQPSITTTNQTAIPASSSQWNDYFAIDVTALTQDIWTAMLLNPADNNGYFLELQNPNYYRAIVLASSDDANSSIWPELYIEFNASCDANFNYCSSTTNPNLYNFSAVNPGQCLIYEWNFGDGTPPMVGPPNVPHIYPGPGSYTVCLTMKTPGGTPLCQACTQICINTPTPSPKQSNNEKNTLQQSNITKTASSTITVTNAQPNPAHTILDVNLQLIKESNVQYRVYDLTGKELLRGNKAMNAGIQKLPLTVEALPAGVYMIEMNDGYSKAIYKFTKE